MVGRINIEPLDAAVGTDPQDPPGYSAEGPYSAWPGSVGRTEGIS
jgi:hypothetical protein